jgi:hypothetical protein
VVNPRRPFARPCSVKYDRTALWDPLTWDDIEAALDNITEGQHIDLKLGPAINDSKEMAKDVAAMSILGGVIAYGIDERDEIAVSAPGVPLAGQANRIYQILGAWMEPPVGVTVRTIPNPATSGEGVVVVVVPPSINAPHYWNERFPVRRGTTTGNLTEREIGDLYQRRSAVASEQAEDQPMLTGYVPPAWTRTHGVDMTDIGVLEVTVSPIGNPRLEYRLASHLRDAAGAASEAVEEILRPVPGIPGAFLKSWETFEARGWMTGRYEIPEDWHRRDATYAATLLYSSGFSFTVTCPLRLDANGTKFTYEWVWAANLLGILAFAGRFYSDHSSAALLRVDVGLSGLVDSWSGPDPGRFREGPVSVDSYKERAVLTVTELAAAPADGAARLLDRLFAAIFPNGPDVRGRLKIA